MHRKEHIIATTIIRVIHHDADGHGNDETVLVEFSKPPQPTDRIILENILRETKSSILSQLAAKNCRRGFAQALHESGYTTDKLVQLALERYNALAEMQHGTTAAIVKSAEVVF